MTVLRNVEPHITRLKPRPQIYLRFAHA